MIKKPKLKFSQVLEFDELYLVAGFKGQLAQIKQKVRNLRRRRLKGARGRGTLVTEKTADFGMIERSSGEVMIRMLPNVQQKTIKPLILQTVTTGTLIYTDEYAIYNRLE